MKKTYQIAVFTEYNQTTHTSQSTNVSVEVPDEWKQFDGTETGKKLDNLMVHYLQIHYANAFHASNKNRTAGSTQTIVGTQQVITAKLNAINDVKRLINYNNSDSTNLAKGIEIAFAKFEKNKEHKKAQDESMELPHVLDEESPSENHRYTSMSPGK